MKLVKITESCWINPEDVSGVFLPTDQLNVIVGMRTGEKHYVAADYGKSMRQTFDRVVKLIGQVAA